MSGFSPEWLQLREPVDHRSRDRGLAAELRAYFAGRSEVIVADLGCGAGSNIRATYELLPSTQSWTLVDYDARLLAVARERLSAWADRCIAVGNGLHLVKNGKSLQVAFRQVDLNTDLDSGLGATPDLVTASALFDLCSEPFIQRFAKAVSSRQAAFYTVLTYNGSQSWTPPHVVDRELTGAFHAHQKTDKGFGVSAGPDAPVALAQGFRDEGAIVREGRSPWTLGAGDQLLIDNLADGFADAVRETREVSADLIAAWAKVRRTGAIVGHTDTLALPSRAKSPSSF